MKSYIRTAIGALSLVFTLSASAQLIIYPADGQSPEQQQADLAECQTWATQNTGIDPVVLAQTSTPQTSSVGGGERVGGAAKGAIGGLAIGAIAGSAGKGAAIGAVTGTMVGGRQARQNQAKEEQYYQTQRQEMMDTWHRAAGTCMEARGYSVG
jgi:uncharacterized protein YcfJ